MGKELPTAAVPGGNQNTIEEVATADAIIFLRSHAYASLRFTI